MNKPTHEKIYLVPEDGIYCWSTTPAPGAQHESNDAVEYVRGDLFETMKAERDALAARIQTAERIEKIFSEMPELKFDDCLKLFADEIRNVEFWAGRKGYLQGHLDALGDPDEIDKEHAAHRANNYAATVRQSGE